MHIRKERLQELVQEEIARRYFGRWDLYSSGVLLEGEDAEEDEENGYGMGHVALDVVGLIPGIGDVADITNAAWLASKGDYLNAAFSLISFVPIIGDIIGKGGKLLTKGSGKISGKAAKKLAPVLKKSEDEISGMFEKLKDNEKVAEYADDIIAAFKVWAQEIIASAGEGDEDSDDDSESVEESVTMSASDYSLSIIMHEAKIRKHIRSILCEEDAVSLVMDEVNAIGVGGGAAVSAGTITGAQTPLGTGPTYPDEPKDRKKKKKKIDKAQKDHRPIYMKNKK